VAATSLVAAALQRETRSVPIDALCRDATKRQFDVVMAWNVDRLGRSLKDLVAFLSELHAIGIEASSGQVRLLVDFKLPGHSVGDSQWRSVGAPPAFASRRRRCKIHSV